MLPAILSLSGPDLTPAEHRLLADARPAGVILFARNIVDRDQVRRLTDAVRAAIGDHALIMTDQEGGPVVRLGPPIWPAFPAQARFGALYDRAPISAMEAARVNALAIAAVLADVGINLAALPVLDLLHDGADPIVGQRSFGADPVRIAALGRVVLDGLAQGGVAGIIKHMPGHGRATVDSHIGLPRVEASEEDLAADILPFQRLAPHAPFGMTAHILYTDWDAERPATVSPTVIGDVIRGRIGFTGLLMSDDINMGALAGTVAERGQAALAAGCDLVLHCSGVLEEGEALAAALPPAPDDLEARIKAALPTARDDVFVLAALLEKRDRLLSV